ncbi:MAG TPA: DUF4145 domain-containing protein [Xanthobacteraceae bacterium]|nr:DUF4145 domain-containing protein [Xanthobacteraceae bacterium]
MTGQLELDRCPHCSIAAPNFYLVWGSQGYVAHTDSSAYRMWGAYACRSCGSIVAVRGEPNSGSDGGTLRLDGIFPAVTQAHKDIPDVARRFLQQAFETLHAPDAAAMLAGSAVDAMLKQLGLKVGSLYARIDEALQKNILTQGMADWAHSVRLGSNRPRHSDEDNPHVSSEEAKQSVEFAEALASFLFVLTARINRGIAAAKKATK